MTENVNWEEFDRMHVIRRLRELVGKWWNVQLNFTDEKGFIRGVGEGKFFNPVNKLCQKITEGSTGFQGCMGTAKQTTINNTNAKKPQLNQCHAGFSTLSVPIRVKGKFLGCVFGDGFVAAETAGEQKVKIKNYVARNADNISDVDSYIESIPVLSTKDIEYLTELIQIVVDEILMTQATLQEAQESISALKGEMQERYSFDQMIGKSSAMQNLYRLLDRVCDSNATVLIQGENGTGKELIAKALHFNSRRKKNKFLVVNCGAFNENLLESELFGHLKGSFTGAVKDKLGLFEAAHDGTLFLDEIGDTSMTMQVKLLRVLQEGTFTPVGSTEVKKSDVRVVAATNKNLSQMVKDGTFREDLYYRLNVINVAVPALRDRKDDIPILADHFLNKAVNKTSTEPKKVSKSCLKKLMNHSWPGNVRELENEIERLVVLSGDDKELSDEFLSERIAEASENKYSGYRIEGKLNDAIAELEKEMILKGLQRTGWNKSKLAKELGISRAGLINKVEKYGLEKRN